VSLRGGKGSPAIKKASVSSRKLVKLIAEFASDKKADDIIIMDMRKLVNFCDYFVVCSGNTDRHTRAIAQGINDGLEELGLDTHFNKHCHDLSWIVYDTGDIVAHIFQHEKRGFYQLEYLWRDAKLVPWNNQ